MLNGRRSFNERKSSYIDLIFDFISDNSACGAGDCGGAVSGVGGAVPCANAALETASASATMTGRMISPVPRVWRVEELRVGLRSGQRGERGGRTASVDEGERSPRRARRRRGGRRDQSREQIAC